MVTFFASAPGIAPTASAWYAGIEAQKHCHLPYVRRGGAASVPPQPRARGGKTAALGTIAATLAVTTTAPAAAEDYRVGWRGGWRRARSGPGSGGSSGDGRHGGNGYGGGGGGGFFHGVGGGGAVESAGC